MGKRRIKTILHQFRDKPARDSQQLSIPIAMMLVGFESLAHTEFSGIDFLKRALSTTICAGINGER
jgi:hypothetical protein